MQVSISHHEQVTVVFIEGDIDSLTADSLSNALTEQIKVSRIHLVLDFNAVNYTSSAGLRSLLGALKECRKLGGDLRLTGAQPSVQRVLSMSGFTSIVKMYGDANAAIASFNA